MPRIGINQQTGNSPLSILEIVIHARPLLLCNTLLLPIQLSNLPTTRRLLSLLVVPLLDEPRESETDALAPGHITACGLVPWAQREIRSLYFPHELWLKPHVRLVFRYGGVGVERFGSVDDERGERLVQFFENCFGEAGPDVANGFVGLLGGVVGGEEEGAVYGCSLSLSVVGAEDD
jgi:hypothetical protein